MLTTTNPGKLEAIWCATQKPLKRRRRKSRRVIVRVGWTVNKTLPTAISLLPNVYIYISLAYTIQFNILRLVLYKTQLGWLTGCSFLSFNKKSRSLHTLSLHAKVWTTTTTASSRTCYKPKCWNFQIYEVVPAAYAQTTHGPARLRFLPNGRETKKNEKKISFLTGGAPRHVLNENWGKK
jgi:hypothetical protein